MIRWVAHRTSGGRRCGIGNWPRLALGLLVLLGIPASRAHAQPTPAGTAIANWAEVTFQAPDGNTYTAVSDTIDLTVGQIAGVDIDPPRSSISDPGTDVAFLHTIANIGNGRDSFTVTATSSSGWSVRAHLDQNGDGALDPGDPLLAGPVTLDMGDIEAILIVVTVPGGAAVRGTTDTVDVVASSLYDPGVSDAVQDLLDVRDAGIVVTLTKSVDLTRATIGDVLTYTLDYQATGTGSATNSQIADAIPLGTSYLPGTLRLNGAQLTDIAGDDAAEFETVGNRVVFHTGDITGGDAGTATFQVQFVGQQSISNTATSSYLTIAGVDSVASNSVLTTLALPVIAFQKDLMGPPQATVGDQFDYRFVVSNSSPDAAAVDVVVSDTLPPELEYVGSQPPAQVNGQTVLWNLNDLSPGETAQLTLTVRVASTVQDTVQVTNTSFLVALNAPTEVAAAGVVTLIGSSAAALALEKSADQLEVGLGETTPYTLILENTGTVPLTDLRVHDRLPEGVRYAEGTLVGADSIRAADRNLTIFVAGPLQPGATHTVRYAAAIVSAGEPNLQNTAYATALDGSVRSNDATAWIRVSSQWPMETRTAIGKVWVDLNDDGDQDADEPGVDGVAIWTADGAVATTDARGRFSYRNLMPGRHAFRLDPASLPAEFRVVETGLSNELVVKDADGWTSPRINFRVVPRGGRVAAVEVPVPWRLLARPRCPGAAGGSNASITCAPVTWPGSEIRSRSEVVVARVHPAQLEAVYFEFAKADLVPASLPVLRRTAHELRARPWTRLEIVGHTDSVGSTGYNMRLSRERTDAVRRFMESEGIAASRLTTVWYGKERPFADNGDDAGRTLNRRADLHILDDRAGSALAYGSQDPFLRRFAILQAAPVPVVEYEITIRNPYDVALEGLSVRFDASLDSATAVAGDSTVHEWRTSSVAVPPIPGGTEARVLGWTGPRLDDSVTVSLELAQGAIERLTAEVHNPLRPVESVGGLRMTLDTLPPPDALPAGITVNVRLEPYGSTWPGEALYAIPAGWQYIPGTSRQNELAIEDPKPQNDRSGAPVLLWPLGARTAAPLELGLKPAHIAAAYDSVRVAAMRQPEEREAEARNAFLNGPPVHFFAPGDGEVVATDRVFVGVRGEPRRTVSLSDNGRSVEKVELRVDGVYDFIGVELEPGPHILKVEMTNSWGNERSDSLALHVTGPPATFEPEERTLRLVAGGHRTASFRIRVYDEWGVPVVNRPFVTVRAENAEPLGTDVDASSLGLQIQPDADGWMRIELRSIDTPGRGKLLLDAGDTSGAIDVEILPDVQPFMVAGVGRAGLGASPDAFASLTARGRVDDRTSLVVSYDSRHLEAGRDAFGRISSPLEQAQYPILGDASSSRIVSSSRSVFSARVERDLDWVSVGDIATQDFAAGLQLTRYRRALTGAGAHVNTGLVSWDGFASSTSQSVQQLQIRGAGISGPYELGPDIRPGTEEIVVETRAFENPERTLARQALVRFVDYQIDYERGLLLLNRPLPATDTYQNPMFIVATFEAEHGGARNWVWGVRASADAGKLLNLGSANPLRIGATVVRDDAQANGLNLVGTDIQMSTGFLALGGELSYSGAPDSSGVAGALTATATLFRGNVGLSAGWMKIGSGFHNPAAVALRSGSSEISLGGRAKLGAGELRVEHQRQEFESGSIRRSHTTGGVVQPVTGNLQVQAGVSSDRFETATGSDASDAGEVRIDWAPLSRLNLWGESRRQFSSSGATYLPDHVGGGAGVRVGSFGTVEATHRRVFLDGPDNDYSLTNLGLRTQLGSNSEAWSAYEIGGVGGHRNAALIGLRTRLQVTEALSADGMFERRQGIGNANAGDPVRALPFLQLEDNYWSFGLGAELLPLGAPYRLTGRAELRDGDFRSTRVGMLAGDVSLNDAFALLSRQEYVRSDQNGLGTTAISSRRVSSLWGLALRPIGSDVFNGLAKVEYVDETNPLGGGVLTTRGAEARLIAALEGIWSPTAATEFGLRYAARRTDATLAYQDGVRQQLRSHADYVGLRSQVDFARWLAVRAEGRLLVERASASRRWDLAPQVVLYPIDALEIAAGYRFGDLRDPDFAVRGGEGAFLTFGVRITENSFPTAADFWRHRFDQE